MPPSKRTEPSKPDADAPLADLTDEELAAATSEAAHAAGTVVTLAVRHPYDALVCHDVLDAEGKPFVITAEGTEVPADQEQAVRDSAKAADVNLRKVS